MAGDWRNTQGCVIFVNQMLWLDRVNTQAKTLYRNELRKPQQIQANSPTYAQKSYCKNP